MKTTFTYATAIAAMLAGNAWATQADASVIDYASVRVGQSTNTEVEGVSFADGDSYGVAAGKAIGPIRLEVGADRLSGDLNFFGPSFDAHAMDYHVNAYLDLPIGDHASLFAGAGLDYVDAEANVFFTDINADGDGWNWAVGGAYRISENMVAEVQYRQLDADLSSDFGDVNLTTDQVTLGLRLAL